MRASTGCCRTTATSWPNGTRFGTRTARHRRRRVDRGGRDSVSQHFLRRRERRLGFRPLPPDPPQRRAHPLGADRQSAFFARHLALGHADRHHGHGAGAWARPSAVPCRCATSTSGGCRAKTTSRSSHPATSIYKITPALTGTLTFNTDFSDAPLDQRQINTGRFGLFFPETRDFFLQDAAVFEFGGNNLNNDVNGRPFFSRNIGLVNGIAGRHRGGRQAFGTARRPRHRRA